MNRVSIGRWFALAGAALLLLCTQVHAYDYNYQLIQDDPAEQINVRGVSNDGVVVGFTESGGFTWDGTSFTPLNVEGCLTRPMGISPNGKIIFGYCVDEDVDPNFEIAFVYFDNYMGMSGVQPFTITASGVLTTTTEGERTIACGVNDAGGAVGVKIQGGEPLSGAVTFESFYFIPDSEDVIIRTVAFPDTDGVVSQTVAMDINNDNVIAGYFQRADGWHGFTFDIDYEVYTQVDLEYDGKIYETFITAINENGDLAGFIKSDTNEDNLDAPFTPFTGGNLHPRDYRLSGFRSLASDGEMTPFDLLPDTRAYDITADGQVLGDMTDIVDPLGTKRHGYKLTITPSTLTQPSPPTLSPAFAEDLAVTEITLPNTVTQTSLLAPMSINENDQIAGLLTNMVTGSHTGFTWWGSGEARLECSGCSAGIMSDINNNGLAIGALQETTENVGYDARLTFTTEESDLEVAPPLTDTSIFEFSFTSFVAHGQATDGGEVAVNLYAQSQWSSGQNGLVQIPIVVYDSNDFESTARCFGTRYYGNAIHHAYLLDYNEYGQAVSANLVMGQEWYLLSGNIYNKNNWKPISLWGANDAHNIPIAINNSGIVAGVTLGDIYIARELEGAAFVREPDGTLSNLPLAPGYAYSTVSDINNNGLIVGTVYNDNTDLSFVYWSRVFNTETGESEYAAPVMIDTLMSSTAYITTGIAIDENSLISLLINGMGPKINDRGHIATPAMLSDGVTPVLLLISSPIEECEETSDGQLDVEGGPICVGETIDVPLVIQDAPKDVDALGFEVTYDPTILEYVKVVRRPLLQDFEYKNENLIQPGLLRIGAYTTENIIHEGTESVMAYVRFRAVGQGICKVDVQNLVDDMAGWTTSPGCVDSSFVDSNADGDINGDGAVTPEDALCAFEKSMEMETTICGDADDILCDVTMDCDCQPDDALCILDYYLELASCLDE